MYYKIIYRASLLTLLSCGGVEGETENNTSDNDSVNATSDIDSLQSDSLNIEVVEEKEFITDLRGVVDLDLEVTYSTWAEGDVIPVTITYPDGETADFDMMNPYARINQYDGTGIDPSSPYEKRKWYIDSLWEVDSEAEVFEEGTMVQGPFMTTAIFKEIYAEPSKDSELIHAYKQDTYTEVSLAWENWVKVRVSTDDGYKDGWAMTKQMEY